MLVIFSCKAHENITMFGSVAQTLLNMMGNSGIVPGAILADDVSSALTQLQQAIAEEKRKTSVKSVDNDEHDAEISIAHRAIPLIALLQSAVDQHCNIMWDRG